MSAWYEESFGEDYMLVYKHRDMHGAMEEVKRMVEWLGLPAGSSIFDLCCGMGRHSLALAGEGYKVTGMDLSKVLLAEARKHDPDGRVTWLEGDMRSIPVEGPFDAVVNLFTSFGYFEDDAENAKVLQEIARILKPGGRFIIDYLNPAAVVANLVPYSHRMDGAVQIDEKRRVEYGIVRKTIALSEPGKPDRSYREQVKLYGLEDFKRLLAGTGLQIDEVHGQYDRKEYDMETSPRLILVGHREPERDVNPIRHLEARS